MSLPIAFTKTERPATPNPWVLSDRTLTVFYGCPEMPRLSHYFLPRLLFAKKLDGANQISPLLVARSRSGKTSRRREKVPDYPWILLQSQNELTARNRR
jgi:hypothetical protein